jgi:hypothetical protein
MKYATKTQIIRTLTALALDKRRSVRTIRSDACELIRLGRKARDVLATGKSDCRQFRAANKIALAYNAEVVGAYGIGRLVLGLKYTDHQDRSHWQKCLAIA